VRARRFFRWVWRVNGVLFLLAALVFVVGMSIGLVAMLVEMHRDARKSSVVKVADEEIRTKENLGNFEPVKGTGVLRASLQADAEGTFGSSSRHATVRNYLFFDPADGSSRWLIPGYKGLIVAMHEMPEEGGCGSRDKPVVGMVYELVEADSNHDGKLDESDAKAVAVSTPGGLRFSRVLSGVEQVKGTSLTPENRILVLYTAAGTLKAALVDGATFALTEDKAVKPVK
jgi:hypothetical protein